MIFNTIAKENIFFVRILSEQKNEVTCGSDTVNDILSDKISKRVYTGFLENVRL